MKAMGLDIGSVTVGVALSDSLRIIAVAHKVIRYSIEDDNLIEEIVEIATTNDVDVIIIGMPYHMNGDNSLGCERSKRFIKKIKEKKDIKIVEIDERLTSVSANNLLINLDVSRKGRKKVVDKIAAQIMLQNYLDATRK